MSISGIMDAAAKALPPVTEAQDSLATLSLLTPGGNPSQRFISFSKNPDGSAPEALNNTLKCLHAIGIKDPGVDSNDRSSLARIIIPSKDVPTLETAIAASYQRNAPEAVAKRPALAPAG